jgi:hypothetical protein
MSSLQRYQSLVNACGKGESKWCAYDAVSGQQVLRRTHAPRALNLAHCSLLAATLCEAGCHRAFGGCIYQ